MKCSKTQTKLCNEEECKVCFERSFASYEGKTEDGKLKVELWNYELNKGITPRNVRKGSIIKRWFNCDVCDHSFLSQLTYITSKIKIIYINYIYSLYSFINYKLINIKNIV